jgi:hypothetical protein
VRAFWEIDENDTDEQRSMAAFLEKCDAEGGWEYVIENWPGIVPFCLKAEATDTAEAIVHFRTRFSFECEELGIQP